MGEWYKADVEITINGEDEASGIEGYYYMIDEEDISWSEKKQVGEKGDKIAVKKEGITKIKIKVVDNAGHETKDEIEVKKDTEAPIFDTDIQVTNETIDGFKIAVVARDTASGNPANGGSITYTCYIEGKEEAVDENETGRFKVTGLERGTTYTIKIITTDPAGNSDEKLGIGTTSSNRVPYFIVNPKSSSKTNNTITLTMTAKDDDEGDLLTYTIRYGEYNDDGEKEAYIDTKKIEDVAEGIDQTIEITELSNYTNYYFEVISEDDKKASTPTYEFDVRTYCLGTSCSGPTTGYVCSNCGYAWSSIQCTSKIITYYRARYLVGWEHEVQ